MDSSAALLSEPLPVPCIPATTPCGPALLALDLGTRTGLALLDSSGRICSGSQPFTPQRFEGGGMRFLRFHRWLTELSHPGGASGGLAVEQVVFEEVRRHAGVDAAHAYGGFLGQLGFFCEHHRIPYQGVPVGTIKRHISGKGNASKEAVIAAIRELGYRPVDYNEADALALLHWAIATDGGSR